MSDEALRALERAARAREGDLEAGWAYARALERARERRPLWLELCRLAREGDARADDALARWAAPGAGLEPAPAVSLDLTRARARVIEDPTLGGATDLVVARDELVVARAGGAAVVVDLAAGGVGGAFPCPGPVALRGDDVLHASDDRRALVLRDLRGAELARADLPWPVGLLAVDRDRALLAPAYGGAPERARAGLAGQTERRFTGDMSSREAGERSRRTHHTDDTGRRHPIVALDVGAAPGRVLWATDREHRAARLLLAGRRALRVTTGWRLERFDVESGAVDDVARVFRTHERRWLRDVDLRADPAGQALVYRATYREEDDDYGPEESEVLLGEVDLEHGDGRWRVVGHWSTAGLWTSPSLAVIVAREGAAHALVGVERPTGRLRFEAVVGRAHGVVVTPEVVVSAGVTADGRRLALVHLDALGGRVLARREVELGAVIDPEPAAVRVALGPGGLEVVVLADGAVAVVEVPA